MVSVAHVAVWAISAVMIAGILLRPRRLPEWIWAVAGAIVLAGSGLLPWRGAWNAVASGIDVYLFLLGILALAEVARCEGVFDWLAARVLHAAGGSRRRLFMLVYGTGLVVTALLSNDATVVLLTPAVLAALKQADAPRMPLLYACVFVASAASFVLPISNPANLVLFPHLPTAGAWLAVFAPAAAVALATTCALLAVVFRKGLAGVFRVQGLPPSLSSRGRLAGVLVALSALLLVLAAATGRSVGEAAFVLGAGTLIAASMRDPQVAVAVVRRGSWSIVPLVAGLFVMAAALDGTGILGLARFFFSSIGAWAMPASNLVIGGIVMLADILLNNLPVGLLLRYTVHGATLPAAAMHAALVGLDLGPNVSVTGSLAALLWMLILRREGIDIDARRFLRVGILVAIPALALSLLVLR